MKFNERLIELRKREGLSQEDLGYKLNVTRQTVSKWELGITTPEMEKLVEMSKLFNISVDDLIKEDTTVYNSYESNYSNSEYDGGVITGDSTTAGISEEKPKKKKGWIIAIIVLVLLLCSLPFIFIGSIFSNVFKGVSGVFDMAGDIFNTSTEMINDISSTMQEQIDSQMNTNEEVPEYFQDVMNQINEGKDKISASQYNGTIELYTGSTLGGFVKNIIDEVAKINQTEERKITIKFGDIETEDVTEIRNIKKSIDQHGNYESYCDYDDEGYIYKVTIEETNNDNERQEMVNEMGETMEALKNMMNM